MSSGMLDVQIRVDEFPKRRRTVRRGFREPQNRFENPLGMETCLIVSLMYTYWSLDNLNKAS
jgi:hypothetical protein